MTFDEFLLSLASAVDVLREQPRVRPVEVLLLSQYMLTAYLTTVPELAEDEMQVLELIHGLLPDGPSLFE